MAFLVSGRVLAVARVPNKLAEAVTSAELAFDRVVDLYSDDYSPESGKLRVGLNASGYYSPAKDHTGLADKIGKISAGGERPALSCIKACRDEQQQ